MRNFGRAISLLLFSAVAANAQCILTAGHHNLLSAEGLATPWELSGGCNQFDPNTQTFVEATIYEPKKNEIFAYSPLVIDKGTKPLVKPVVPKISKHAIIVYHFGCNANTLTLADKDHGKTLKKAKCVNGLPGSVFNQFAYCNGPTFFNAAKRILHSKQLPRLGRALDGFPCPTVRDFAIVDQDQSDNVVTTYLQVGNLTAQNTAHNLKKFPLATVVANPSDNALLSVFIDPAIGCKPFAIPELDNPGHSRSTLASDEIFAAAHQRRPIALVPLNDPMTLKNGTENAKKTNLYRAGTFQHPLRRGETDKAYCREFGRIAPPVILRQRRFTLNATTPAANMGNSLFTFLGVRFNASWVNLNCINLLGKQSPIIANLNNGVATSLTFHIHGKTIGPIP